MLNKSLSRELSYALLKKPFDLQAVCEQIASDAYRGKLAGALCRGMTESWYHSSREDCLSIGAVAVCASLPRLVRSIRFDMLLSGASPDAVRALYDGLRFESMCAMGRAEYLTHSHTLKTVPNWLSPESTVGTRLYSWDEITAEAFRRCGDDAQLIDIMTMLLNGDEIPGQSSQWSIRKARKKAISILKSAIDDMYGLAL